MLTEEQNLEKRLLKSLEEDGNLGMRNALKGMVDQEKRDIVDMDTNFLGGHREKRLVGIGWILVLERMLQLYTLEVL
jgi:hypothetical protein